MLYSWGYNVYILENYQNCHIDKWVWRLSRAESVNGIRLADLDRVMIKKIIKNLDVSLTMMASSEVRAEPLS